MYFSGAQCLSPSRANGNGDSGDVVAAVVIVVDHKAHICGASVRQGLYSALYIILFNLHKNFMG